MSAPRHVPDYIMPARAARALAISRQTAAEWIRSGKLEYVRLGERVMVPTASVLELREQLKEKLRKRLAKLEAAPL